MTLPEPHILRYTRWLRDDARPRLRSRPRRRLRPPLALVVHRSAGFLAIGLGLLQHRFADAAHDGASSPRRCRARVWFPGRAGQLRAARVPARRRRARRRPPGDRLPRRGDAARRPDRGDRLARAAPPGRRPRCRASRRWASCRAIASRRSCLTLRRRRSPFSPAPASGRSGRCASPDMGPLAVLDRFRQIAPKVLVACDGYRYGGVAHDRMALLRGVRR